MAERWGALAFALVSTLVVAGAPAPVLAFGADTGDALARNRWAAEIPASALLTFIGEPQRLLVIEARPRSPGLRAAAELVDAHLRASGLFPSILGAQAIGDVSGLTNREIVARAVLMPIDRVVILRVDHGVLYLDTYLRDGTRYAGFALSEGARLSPRYDPQASQLAREAIFEPAMAQTQASTLGAQELDDNERDYLAERLHTGPKPGAYRGLGRLHLDEREALEELGVRALVDNDHKRRKLGGQLGTVGLVFGSSFVLTGILGLITPDYLFETGQTELTKTTNPLSAVGIGLGLTLQISGIVALRLRPAFDAETIETLVEAHNEQLRRHLDLPEDTEERIERRSRTSRDARGRRAQLASTLRLAPQGLGLSLGGRF